MTSRRVLPGVFVFLAGLALATAAPHARSAADWLPARLSDAEFWALSEQLSEPDGYFRYDNLLSNELRYPEIIPALIDRVPPGGVYLGVGPEQNFNYIAALRPKMAFITDVRRGNLHAQLMYKALFELAADRATFVSLLFTKPRPETLTHTASAYDLMAAYWDIETSGREVYDANLRAIRDHLTGTRALPLSAEDLSGIEYVYHAFYWFGPRMTYNSSNASGFGRRGNRPTYADLMSAVDLDGQARSFLASEEAYRVVRNLHRRNLIVPVIGNFGGARALRAIGEYVRERGAVIAAFYLSNVEQYLHQDFIWDEFCANVASMPLDEHSTFIRSRVGGRGLGFGSGFTNDLGEMQAETDDCAPSPAAGGG
jgi:hypothetical protein